MGWDFLMAVAAFVGMTILAPITAADGTTVNPELVLGDHGRNGSIAKGLITRPRDFQDVALATDLAQGEDHPALAVHPRNSDRLVALMNVRDGWRYGCVVRRSSDGGRTWSAPILLPNARPEVYFCEIAYAPDGERIYAAYTDHSWSHVWISISDDDGATWQDPIVAMESDSYQHLYGWPTLAVPFCEQDRDRVYLVALADAWDQASRSVAFARSADRGRTWTKPLELASSSSPVEIQGVSVAAGASADLIVAWHLNNGPDRPGPIEARRSTDHGKTFGSVITAVDRLDYYENYWTDLSVRIDASGTAHMVYNHLSTDDGIDIHYTRSRPPYSTWAEPMPLQKALPGHRQTAPALTLEAGEHTDVLHVMWADASLKIDGAGKWDYYYTRKLAAPRLGWSPAIRISDKPSLQFGYLWRYGPHENALAAAGGKAFAIWADRRTVADVYNPESNIYGTRIRSGVRYDARLRGSSWPCGEPTPHRD